MLVNSRLLSRAGRSHFQLFFYEKINALWLLPLNYSSGMLANYFYYKLRFSNPMLPFTIPAGLRYMMISAFGFAMMAVCVKEAGSYGIPVFEIIAARALVSLVLSYADVYRKKINPFGTQYALLFARGAVGTIAMIGTYYSVSTLPLAEATVLQYLYPVFTAILALFFLGEKVRSTTMICIVLGILGLTLMVQPGVDTELTNSFPTLSLVGGLTGAVGSAIAYVIVRRLSQTEDPSVIIFYFPLVSLPLSLILAYQDFVIPSFQATIVLILVGVFTQVGQVGLTKAMKVEEAAKASAYSYVQVIFAGILGFVLFDEIPPLATFIGGSLIILGALINVLGDKMIQKYQQRKVG